MQIPATSLRFGPLIKACRLGYHWYEPWKAYVRASANCNGKIILELAPQEPKELKNKQGLYHYCWWEKADHLPEGVDCILDLTKMHPQYFPPKAYTTFHVSDSGRAKLIE